MSTVGLNYRSPLVPEGCDTYKLIQAHHVSTLFESKENAGKIVTKAATFKVTVRAKNVTVDLNQNEWEDVCRMVAAIMIAKQMLEKPFEGKLTIKGIGFVKEKNTIVAHRDGNDTTEHFNKIVDYILGQREPSKNTTNHAGATKTTASSSSPKSSDESTSSPNSSPPPSPDLSSKKAPKVKLDVEVDDKDLESSSSPSTDTEEDESDSPPPSRLPKADRTTSFRSTMNRSLKRDQNVSFGAQYDTIKPERAPIFEPKKFDWFSTPKRKLVRHPHSKETLVGRLPSDKRDRINAIRMGRNRNATLYRTRMIRSDTLRQPKYNQTLKKEPTVTAPIPQAS